MKRILSLALALMLCACLAVPAAAADEGEEESAVEFTDVPASHAFYQGVKDNGYGPGKLNNGKPITEENVIALMKEFEAKFPQGTPWGSMGSTKNNNVYNNKDSVIGRQAISKCGIDSVTACGGFAAFLIDYLFGTTSNPVRKVTDPYEAHIGDVVVSYTPQGQASHVWVMVNGTETYNNQPVTHGSANGNNGGKILYIWSSSQPLSIRQKGDLPNASYYNIFTRYPEQEETPAA